jgi:TonB-dependent starch-binding outer membrane protein SusC
MKKKLLLKIEMMTTLTSRALGLQLLMVGMVLAEPINAQYNKSIREVIVNIDLNQPTVLQTFSNIEAQTDFIFHYHKSDIDQQLRLDLNIAKTTVADLLEIISEKATLKFKQINSNIYVNRILNKKDKKIEIIIQTRTVTGKVTSIEDGEGLPGVNVIEMGTSNGTVTNVLGEYTLSVSEGAILVFSSVGYTREEIQVGNRSMVDLVMRLDVQQLEELVVVGYGTVRKSDLTGAVSSITAEEIEKQPLSSLEQAIQGKAAGVQVTQASHSPGGGISVRVRGGNSINSQVEPLYVIDGIPIYSSNNQIPSNGPNDGVIPQMNMLAGVNPGDIESIEILKDASATAIYGARGANGVVLITTKRGVKGTTKLDYSNYFGIQNMASEIKMLNAYQFATLHNEMSVNRGMAPMFTGQTIDGEYFGTPQEYQNGSLPDTDWQDAILRRGKMTNHQLSLSGGNDYTQYAVSANHFIHEGIVEGGDYNRTSIRLNLDAKVNDWFSLGNSLTFSHNLSNNSGSETGLQWFNGGTISSALKSWPVFSVYNEDGSINTDAGIRTLRGNPVAYAKYAKNELVNNRLLGNIFGTVTIMEGLTFRSSFGVDLNDIKRNRYFPTTTYQGSLSNGSASKNITYISSWVNENILSFNKKLGIHSFNAVAGYTMQEEIGEGSSASAQDFPSDVYLDNNMGAGVNQTIPSGSWKYKWSMASWLGRINYVLLDKYLFTVTGRADGSSKFGADNKWAFFPSVAVGWRISEEDFMENIPLFSNLKVRLSYGETGNSEIGLYRSQSFLGVQSYTFAEGSKSSGIGPGKAVWTAGRMANPNLKWETTSQYDVGLEMGFIQDRLNFTIDVYEKTTTDLLLNVNLPFTSGFTTALKNVGSLENKGVEFSMDLKALVGNFRWDIGGNISFNRNKILSLTEGGAITLSNDGIDKHGGSVYLDVGLPVGVWRSAVRDGIFNSQQEVDDYVNENGQPIQPGAKPGDVKFVDVDGSGRWDGNDLDIVGDPNPKYIFGITNNFSFKNFDLSVFINGIQGNDINAPTLVHATDVNMSNGNLIADMWNRWTPENPQSNIAALGATYGYGYQIYDGSFIRLKNVRLAYNIPSLNINWLRNGQIYINLQNLLTITDYPGYDPEVNAAGQSAWQRGIDLNSYPVARTYMIGFKVGL